MCWLTSAGCAVVGPQVPAQARAMEGPCPAFETPHPQDPLQAIEQEFLYGCMQAKVAARVHVCADVLAPVAASITALAVRRLSGNLQESLEKRPNLKGGALAEALRMRQVFMQVATGAALLFSAAVPDGILFVSRGRDDPAPQLPPVVGGEHNLWSSPALC